MQKLLEMTKKKTLLGPGYYNVNHASHERLGPSHSFPDESTVTIDPKMIAIYANEIDQMHLNRAQRERDRAVALESQARHQYLQKSQKEKLMADLVDTVKHGGKIEKEDADLLVKKIIDQPPLMKDKRLKKPQGVMSCKVPRWGALTFEEKVANDMVLNRMKDIKEPPVQTNFVEKNFHNQGVSSKKRQRESSVEPSKANIEDSVYALDSSAALEFGSRSQSRLEGISPDRLKEKMQEKHQRGRDALINKLVAKENKR